MSSRHIAGGIQHYDAPAHEQVGWPDSVPGDLCMQSDKLVRLQQGRAGDPLNCSRGVQKQMRMQTKMARAAK